MTNTKIQMTTWARKAVLALFRAFNSRFFRFPLAVKIIDFFVNWGQNLAAPNVVDFQIQIQGPDFLLCHIHDFQVFRLWLP